MIARVYHTCYTGSMKQWTQPILLVLAIILAYFWQKIPLLSPFSLQAFLGAMVGYLIVKKLQNETPFWHLAPAYKSFELVLLVFAVLTLIVATGVQLFFPLLYVLLFFLVFATDEASAIVTSCGISLFFYAMTSSSVATGISTLISLPLVTLFFLLAKKQYQIAVDESKQRLHSDDWNVQRSESTGWFMVKFLKPTIIELKELSGAPDKNEQMILQKLLRVESRMNQLIKEFTQTENGLIEEIEKNTDQNDQIPA